MKVCVDDRKLQKWLLRGPRGLSIQLCARLRSLACAPFADAGVRATRNLPDADMDRGQV